MSIDDLVNKGKDLFQQNKDKISEALKSDKAEEISDKLIQGASDAAKKVVPEQHHGTVDDIAGKADGAVGNQ